MKPFDSHCHMDDTAFDADRKELLEQIGRQLSGCLCAASDMASSYAAVQLAKAWPFIWASAGIHPHEAKTASREAIDEICALYKSGAAVAIGETGLDYHYDYSPREVQRRVFAEQLEAAASMAAPVIIHEREAHEDCMDILSGFKGRLRGVMHCFSGGAETARRVLDMGLYISFAGPLTFKNARRQQEAAAYAPIERLLVETDAPYMSPEPLRGRRNTPLNVAYVAERLALIKGVAPEAAAEITARNAKELFGITI